MKNKTKILILGHKGMLGNMVFLHYTSLNNDNYEIITIDDRFPENSFKYNVVELKPHFVINCIGIIPQKENKDFTINIDH